MSKRTSAIWKRNQQWKADFEARNAEHARKQEVQRLTADLPINSRVSIAIVQNPHGGRGEQIQVLRSTRDDPLAGMLSRGVIDVAMFNAGRRWQHFHEMTQIGPIGAIDTTKEAVDGGKMRDPITDKQIDAFRELGRADVRLGQWGAQLVRNLLAERMSIGKMCEIYECKTARQSNFLSMRVRECLEDLGILWGFVGGKQRAG